MTSPNLLLCLITALYASSGWTQDLPIQPKLAISGPELQSFGLVIEYADNGQTTSLFQTRIALPQAEDAEQATRVEAVEELEFGHQGFRVLVLVPTNRPVTITLQDGEQILEQKTSSGTGVLVFQRGELPAASRANPRYLPNEEEQALLQRLLRIFIGEPGREEEKRQAERMEELQRLIASQDIANVDWPTVHDWVETVIARLGQVRAPQSPLDGWLSIEGNIGARLLTGILPLEQGKIRLSVLVLDGKIVDLEMDSFGQLEEWFEGPIQEEYYIAEATRFLNLILEQRFEAAHQCFGRKYREDIPFDVLEGWAQGLTNRHGKLGMTGMRNVVFDFEPPNFEVGTFKVFFRLEGTEQPGRFVGQVQFKFDAGADVISRGSLAAVQIEEIWSSARPDLLDLTTQVLQHLQANKPLESDWFAPDVALLLDLPRLQRESRELREPFRQLDLEIDWERWRAGANESYSFAEGPIETSGSNRAVYARFNFIDDRLLGLRLEGENWAWNSHVRLHPLPQIDQSARGFWGTLFKGELQAAHSQLAPAFQAQMSLAGFEEMIRQNIQWIPEAEFELISIVVDEELRRPAPLTINCLTLLKTPNGITVPLLCKFRPGAGAETTEIQNTAWELMSFADSFALRLPQYSDQTEQMDVLIGLLNEAEADPLHSELGLSEVQRPMVESFLGFLKRRFLPMHSQGPSKLARVYQNRKMIDWQSELVSSKDREPILLSAKLEAGSIRAVGVPQAILKAFVEQPEAKEAVRRVVQDMLERWVAKAGSIQAELAPQMQSRESWLEIDFLRKQLLVEVRAGRAIEVRQCEFDETIDAFLCVAQCGELTLELELQVEPFRAKIHSLLAP